MQLWAFSAESREGLDDRLWKIMAHVARYGGQQRSEMLAMTVSDLSKFSDELSELIGHERASDD